MIIRGAIRMEFDMNKLALVLLLFALSSPLAAQDYEITNWTIDSGGTMSAESAGGEWQLRGTIGQWDATEARAIGNGQWRLTGGFWADLLGALEDLLFSDRFEQNTP
jgi:hypothetical protein